MLRFLGVSSVFGLAARCSGTSQKLFREQQEVLFMAVSSGRFGSESTATAEEQAHTQMFSGWLRTDGGSQFLLPVSRYGFWWAQIQTPNPASSCQTWPFRQTGTLC